MLRGFLDAKVGGLPRPFWVIFAGTLVNRLGTMVDPFLAFYLTGVRGMSLAMTGFVMAVFGAGSVLSQVIGGFLTDRIGRRATLAGGMVATGAAMLCLGYVRGLAALMVTVFLLGVAMDAYRPASQAMVADLVPPRERPRAYGLLFWAVNMGFSVATVTGGWLARAGFGWLFWIDALTCLVFAVLVWRAVPETRPAGAATVPAGETARSVAAGHGYGMVLRDRAMIGYTVAGFAYCLVYLQAYTTVPLAMRAHGLSASAYGTAMALNGIVIVLVQPLVLNRLAALDHSRVLAAGVTVVGIGFGLYTFASSAPEFAAIVVVWTFGEIVVSCVMTAILADLAPARLRGRYSGVYGTAWSVAALVAPIGGTALLSHGARMLFPVCAVLALTSAAGQLLLAPLVRRRAVQVRAAEARTVTARAGEADDGTAQVLT